MKNNEKYIKQIMTLSASGCGVVFTRTREPFRAMDALKEFAFSKSLPFNVWNFVDGWKTRLPTDDSDKEPAQNKNNDVFSALKWIADVDNNGKKAHDKGVFVMHAIHPWLDKHPGLIECLRHYVRDFTELSSVRLVIVVPEGVNLPDELTHDIPTVDFDLPSLEEIGEILDYVIESGTPEDQEVPEMFTAHERETIIASAGGLTQMEAELAFAKAIVDNRTEDTEWHEISFDAFNRSVLDSKTEVVKQSEVLELMEPVDMDDVGGLDQLKEWIYIAADSFTEEARDFGVDVPDGIAAIGPPGTGKTLIAKAIASALGQPLVKFDVSKCFGSLVGQSESRVRAALKQLEAMGRVTVLFDEVDKSLGGSHQSGGDSGVSKRVLGAILTFMQETKAPIFPIYTANRVDSLPPELLRKGRLDEVFSVMPPNRVEREAIFKIHLAKRKQDVSKITDLHLAIDASKGYVSSELEAGVKEAVKAAFHRKVKVSGALIREMLGNMKPISEAFKKDFDRMSKWATNNARPASSPSPEEESEQVGGDGSVRTRKRRSLTAGQ